MSATCVCGHEKEMHFKDKHWCEYCECTKFILVVEIVGGCILTCLGDCRTCDLLGFGCDGHTPDL